MICPHCKTIVDLTWKRYWAAPLGRHKCPECSERFQLEFTTSQIALRCAIVLPGALIGVFIYAYTKTWLTPACFYTLFCATVVIPLDRLIDNRWRKTIPILPPGNA